MPRANIRGADKDIITDDGAVLFSVAKGEQIHLNFTLDYLTDLTGYTIAAQVVEGASVAGDLDAVPFQEAASPEITQLVILDPVVTDNMFKVVLPHDLADNWATQPTPDDPSEGFFSLSIADPNAGDNQQIFVPVRGRIQVRYNPLETV